MDESIRFMYVCVIVSVILSKYKNVIAPFYPVIPVNYDSEYGDLQNNKEPTGKTVYFITHRTTEPSTSTTEGNFTSSLDDGYVGQANQNHSIDNNSNSVDDGNKTEKPNLIPEPDKNYEPNKNIIPETVNTITPITLLHSSNTIIDNMETTISNNMTKHVFDYIPYFITTRYDEEPNKINDSPTIPVNVSNVSYSNTTENPDLRDDSSPILDGSKDNKNHDKNSESIKYTKPDLENWNEKPITETLINTTSIITLHVSERSTDDPRNPQMTTNALSDQPHYDWNESFSPTTINDDLKRNISLHDSDTNTDNNRETTSHTNISTNVLPDRTHSAITPSSITFDAKDKTNSIVTNSLSKSNVSESQTENFCWIDDYSICKPITQIQYATKITPNPMFQIELASNNDKKDIWYTIAANPYNVGKLYTENNFDEKDKVKTTPDLIVTDLLHTTDNQSQAVEILIDINYSQFKKQRKKASKKNTFYSDKNVNNPCCLNFNNHLCASNPYSCQCCSNGCVINWCDRIRNKFNCYKVRYNSNHHNLPRKEYSAARNQRLLKMKEKPLRNSFNKLKRSIIYRRFKAQRLLPRIPNRNG